MEAQAQNHLETWAVVELMGHQKEVGFVTTQYYGSACMFKIDVPELPEREIAIVRPRWVGDTHVPAGTVVKEEARAGRSRLVGVSSVYALNPCDRATAIAMLEQNVDRDIKIVALAGARQLPLTASEESTQATLQRLDEEEEEDCEDEEDCDYQPLF
jgi:hypothetical protein